MLRTKIVIKKHLPVAGKIARRGRILAKLVKYSVPNYKMEYSVRYKLYKVYASKSLLRRKLGNVDPSLQEAKISNLCLALPKFDNLVIKPGQKFSFWKILGEPTYKKGYVDGMLLSEGEVLKGVGGGICQLANIIHWLFLHTDLVNIEHWHHDYDVFPDSGRFVPFGSGAGVLYNLFDLRYYNPTKETFTLALELTAKHLIGVVYSNHYQVIKHRIAEEDHHFYKENKTVYRENKLFKISIDKITGLRLSKVLVKHNKSKVLYEMRDNL